MKFNFIFDFSPQLRNAIINATNDLKSVEISDSELILEEQIGAGATSQVYKGKWKGKTVAIKRCLICDLMEDPLKDFMKETQILSSVNHPNIVKFYGATLKPPHFYIVQEYCEKGSLDLIYKNFSLDEKIKILIQVANGMKYLHSKKIIHRDLKLANLLMNDKFEVKISDFGTSRFIRLNKPTTKIGTIECIAPEVLKKSAYSFEADVYSFGILFWEIIFELPLYENLNVYEITQRVINGMRPPIPKDPIIPKKYIKLMKQCWDPNPKKRPSFDKIINILQSEN